VVRRTFHIPYDFAKLGKLVIAGMGRRWVRFVLYGAALAVLASSHESSAGFAVSNIEDLADPEELSEQASGTFSVLTYNVAGIPGILSGWRSARNVPRVSPLLNRYDLVFVQEDFSYHRELVGRAEHRHQWGPTAARSALVGDGLTTLSKFPIEPGQRVRWDACSGYLFDQCDCFGEKGFAAFDVRISRSVTLRLYNLHGDAGHADDDVAARRRGFEQLARHLEAHAADLAVVVAGDTNLDETDPRDMSILREFLARTGLRELCREFTCRDRNLDRVLYRGSRQIELLALDWRTDERFVDEQGHHLSDHMPRVANLAWRLRW
jgi:endonuclease/exonuclease/phosphatase family metal-dependent hydrolase